MLEGTAVVCVMDVELSCIGSDEEDKDKDNHGGDGNMQDKNRNEGQVLSTKHGKEAL